MTKRLSIIALSNSANGGKGTYSVVLQETTGVGRVIPIIIGMAEAQAIAVAIERSDKDRPMTHKLFTNVLSEFNIKLKHVVIHKLVNGIFYSKLICECNGREKEIDSRTSDAIALAVRSQCNIYIVDEIINEVGILTDGSKPTTEDKITKAELFKNFTLEGLNEELQKALEVEDYLKAIDLRDEINFRKNGTQ